MAKYLEYKSKQLSVGDTVKVALLVAETADKMRQQAFEGIIIAIDNRESGKSFTVRKIGVGGIGVERILPLDSPAIADITVITKGDVRRAKLYYLRDRTGKLAMKVKKKVLSALKPTI